MGFPIGPLRNSLSVEGARSDFYYNENKSASVLPRMLRGKAGLDMAVPLGDMTEIKLGGSFMAMRSDEQTSARGGLNRLDYLRGDAYVEAELFPLDGVSLTMRAYDNYYQRDKDTYNGIMQNWTTGENHENENYAALEATGEYAGFDNWLLTLGFEGAYNSMDKYNLRNNGTFAAADQEALFAQAERYREGVYSILLGIRGGTGVPSSVSLRPPNFPPCAICLRGSGFWEERGLATGRRILAISTWLRMTTPTTRWSGGIPILRPNTFWPLIWPWTIQRKGCFLDR